MKKNTTSNKNGKTEKEINSEKELKEVMHHIRIAKKCLLCKHRETEKCKSCKNYNLYNDSFNYLYELSKPEFDDLQKKFYVSGNDKSDNEQECLMMLMKAITKYDPKLCKNFRYYVKLLCRGQLISLIHKSQRYKSSALNVACSSPDGSLDVSYKDKDGNEYSLYDFIPCSDKLLSDQVANKDYIDYIKNKFFSGLTKLEQNVIELRFFEDLSYTVIAKRLKKKAKSVDNAIQRAINKLPKIMGSENEDDEFIGKYGLTKKRSLRKVKAKKIIKTKGVSNVRKSKNNRRV